MKKTHPCPCKCSKHLVLLGTNWALMRPVLGCRYSLLPQPFDLPFLNDDGCRWLALNPNQLGRQGLQGPDIEFKTRAAQFIVLVPLKAISVIDLGRVHLKRRRTADTVHREELIISKLWTESAWMNWMALWWKTGKFTPRLTLLWPWYVYFYWKEVKRDWERQGETSSLAGNCWW